VTPSSSAPPRERQPIPLPNGADNPCCPKCGGRMWDNRANKHNPKAPDFRCRNRSCDGVLWPGQRNVAVSPIDARNLYASETEAQMNGRGTPSLREKYVDLVTFVLDQVRPIYQEHGLACGDETVAAITATLFIGETRREGL